MKKLLFSLALVITSFMTFAQKGSNSVKVDFNGAQAAGVTYFLNIQSSDTGSSYVICSDDGDTQAITIDESKTYTVVLTISYGKFASTLMLNNRDLFSVPAGDGSEWNGVWTVPLKNSSHFSVKF